MNERRKNHKGQAIGYQLAGWILFVLCAIFFIASALNNRDTLTLIGSVIFLISCIVFIIPLIFESKKAGDEISVSSRQSNSVDAQDRETD